MLDFPKGSFLKNPLEPFFLAGRTKELVVSYLWLSVTSAIFDFHFKKSNNFWNSQRGENLKFAIDFRNYYSTE
jgi:hypothetical protein